MEMGRIIPLIREEQKRTGLTMSEIIRRALDLYFKEQGR